MALSRIWSAFIIIAILVASTKYFTTSNHNKIFSQMIVGKQSDTSYSKFIASNLLPASVATELISKSEIKIGEKKYYKLDNGEYLVSHEQQANGVLATCKDAVDICLGLIGIMALFMGLMSIAEKAGGIRLLSRIIAPFFTKLFPEVPKDHPALGMMMLNYSANLLNLDNAATPFGIKAMQSLQELNPKKDTASNAQIMFLSLHAAGLTLIPVSIIAIRSKMGAASATDIFLPCLITTFVATVAAMIIVSIKQKINLLQPAILTWVMGISAIILALVLYVHYLSKDDMDNFSGALGNGILILIILLIVVGGIYKKIDVFDSFVEGAKGGFETTIKIIPYLVGMLVAISLLRTSGTFGVVIEGMKQIFVLLGFDTRFVEALPTALVRPLSGSGARGMMVDTIKTYGVDSFPGRLSSVMQGCSDTTFYVVAIYYGSVAIKKIKYSITAMLLADLVGIITAILLSYLFFT